MTTTIEENHCKDCCCAQAWKALGMTVYDGKSIPEHITHLHTRLEASEAKWVEMREALIGMNELCGNYFDESQLVCVRDKEIWKQMLAALSPTCGNSVLEELKELRKDKERLLKLANLIWETRWASEADDYQDMVGIAAEIRSGHCTAIDAAKEGV